MNKFFSITFFLVIFISGIFITALPIKAQTNNSGINSAFDNAKRVADQSSYNYDISLETMVGDVIQIALSLLGTLFVCLIIYAGYIWLTAAGNEQRIEKAKKLLFESILGLVIVIAAYAVTYFLVNIFKNQVRLQ